MVKISNGVNVFVVSNGAFEGIYAQQGYTKLVEKTEAAEQKDLDTDSGEEEIVINGLLDKPISGWNKEELKTFSDFNGIDTSAAKTVAEVKAIVKEFIEKAE